MSEEHSTRPQSQLLTAEHVGPPDWWWAETQKSLKAFRFFCHAAGIAIWLYLAAIIVFIIVLLIAVGNGLADLGGS